MPSQWLCNSVTVRRSPRPQSYSPNQGHLFQQWKEFRLRCEASLACSVVFYFHGPPQTWDPLQVIESCKISYSPLPLHYTMRLLRSRKPKEPLQDQKQEQCLQDHPFLAATSWLLIPHPFHLGLPITAHVHSVVHLLTHLPHQNSSTQHHNTSFC